MPRPCLDFHRLARPQGEYARSCYGEQSGRVGDKDRSHAWAGETMEEVPAAMQDLVAIRLPVVRSYHPAHGGGEAMGIWHVESGAPVRSS
jgi:hypothetical protein